MIEALVGFAVLLLLIFLRIPIAISMTIVGFFGFAIRVGWAPSFSMVGQLAYDTGLTYGISVLPLFVLMGNFVNRAGFSDELYKSAHAFFGHRRGGVAIATVVACGGFSAVSGSSLATAATMAKVAMPSMKRYGYADSLATGSVAAGGTLGILIPPSVVLVLYGIMTETDIGKLFLAGILPGILGIVGYSTAIAIVTRIWPHLGPPAQRTAWLARLRSLGGIWGVVVLFVIVMGGIYGGVFTPTEAGGIGASGAFFFALVKRTLTWKVLYGVLLETARTTSMIFFVLIGALIFANFINHAGLPSGVADWARRLAIDPAYVILLLLLIYILLGCVLESLSMVLLTVPTFFPVVVGLGYDPIWFGIIVVVVMEISLITPPVGLNVFVLRSVRPDISTGTIFRGVTPFWIADIFRLALLVFVPWLSLVLPGMM